MSTDWPPNLSYDPETGELLDEPPAVPNIAEFSGLRAVFCSKTDIGRYLWVCPGARRAGTSLQTGVRTCLSRSQG